MAAAQAEEKGSELFQKAENKFNSKGFLGFGGGSSKYEDAAENFVKAGNQFKLAKNWDLAGKSFVRAAECFEKLNQKYEAASNYQQAGSMYRKSTVAEAAEVWRRAVELYTDEGRFTMAAKTQKEIAEMFEQEVDHEKAMEAYKTAAEFYEGEGSTSSANQCSLKVATFAALLGKYDEAVQIFEKVAKDSIDNNLLKWSVKDYFLRAGICHLATGDYEGAKRALQRYQEMDASFASQRECKFLEAIVEAADRADPESFTDAIVEYDSISKLDQWKTSLLLVVKKAISGEGLG